MGISINLEFGDGTFERGFDNSQLVVTIITPDSSITQVSVQLSPSPLPSLYQAWKKQYDFLRPQGRQSKFKMNQATNISVQNCAINAKTIRRELNEWLEPLNLILEPILQPYSNEEIYPVIYTGKVTSLATKNILHRLPWQEWNLNSKMFEPTLCFNSYQADTVQPNTVVADDADSYKRVTIIGIFGDSTNINIKADEDLLKELEKQGADLHCLYQPNRADFNLLWEKHPDILYFAGHSNTEDNGDGVIKINPHQQLSLADMRRTLSAAKPKLVIFNSCDGLGLARQLADLNIPCVIVWREEVPDPNAIKFIEYFLSAFASDKSLLASVREAKDKVFELSEPENSEKQLPGVSWLLTVCQTTISPLPTWSDLGGLTGSLPDNPYRGLSAFQEEDADFYFGQEKFITDLLNAVFSMPLVSVIGASGSGKSSVVFAGLIPRLRTIGNVEIIIFRPGNKPFDNLSIALPHLECNPLPRNSLQSQLGIRLAQIDLDLDWRNNETNLCHYIETIVSASGYQHLVLIADQFEELYTLTPETERDSFLKALYFAVNHAPNFTLVLTLRADFSGIVLNSLLGKALQKYAPLFLTPMDSQELRDAIEKPAAKMKVRLESGLTDRYINDLGDCSKSLVLLQFALTKSWEKQQKWSLTHQAYNEIGGLKKAFAKYADGVLNELRLESSGNRYEAERIFIQLERIFIQLVNAGTEDTRRVATREEVGLENWGLVQKLADKGLVVTGRDETNGVETVEIVHEAVFKESEIVSKWIQDNREFRIWQERNKIILEDWKKSNYNAEFLLQGKSLTKAEDYLQKRTQEISKEEQEYIKKSIELREGRIKQDKQRRKRQLLGALIAIIFFAGLSIFSGFQWRDSQINLINSLTESSEALLLSNQKLDALMRSLQAVKNLEQPLLKIFPQDTKLKKKIKTSLQKAVYQVQERNRLNGHPKADSITVSFTPDNQNLVTAGNNDGSIQLWDITGKKVVKPWSTQSIKSISISPNGILATAGGNIITLWDLKGRQLSTWEGNQGWIRSISFSPDGQLLATGGEEGSSLWNLQKQQLAKLDNNKGWDWTVRFSPNGQFLATGGIGGTRLWNLRGQQLAKLIEDQVRSVSFSPDGQKLATTGDHESGSEVSLWDLQGQKSQKLAKWLGGPWIVNFSPDGQMLAYGGDSGITSLLDLKRGNLLSKLSHNKGIIRHISFSSNGKLLATAGDDDTVYLWDLQGKELSKFVHHQGQVEKVIFSSDGQQLATVGDDSTIHLWDLKGQESITIKGRLVSFIRDNRQIAIVGDDGTVSLWNLQGQKLGQPLVLEDANSDFKSILSLSFSPDNRLLAAITKEEGTVSMWNLQGQKLFKFSASDDNVNSQFHHLSFSPDSRFLAGAANDGSITVWDLQSGKNTRYKLGTNGFGMIFYQNNQRLAATGDGGYVSLWDLQGQGKLLSKFLVHQGAVTSLSLSPNGQQLATAGENGTVRLWNFQGEQLGEFPANSRNVIFSPDGQRLATVGVDGTAKLWQIETFEQLLKRGCSWVSDYLKNSNVDKSQSDVCNYRDRSR